MIREIVHNALRKDILCCRLRPGTNLFEQTLASRFSVSKSPVRDALQRLEREGLVIVQPRYGYRVAPLSLEEAKDMFSLRRYLETICVKQAVKTASDEQLRVLDDFKTYIGDSQEDFIRYNSAFHVCTSELSGNKRLAQVSQNLIEHMERLIYLSVDNTDQKSTGKLVDEHVNIINAICARNGPLASRLTKAHIVQAERRVIGALEWLSVAPNNDQ